MWVDLLVSSLACSTSRPEIDRRGVTAGKMVKNIYDEISDSKWCRSTLHADGNRRRSWIWRVADDDDDDHDATI